MAKPIRWILLSTSVLLAIVLLSLTYLLATASGARFVLATASKLSNQALSARVVAGSLTSGLQIESLSVEVDTLELMSEQAQLKIRWLALLQGKLVIEEIALNDSTFLLKERAPKQEDNDASLPSAPLAIELERFTLTSFLFRQAKQSLLLDNVDASFAWRDDKITVNALDVHTETHNLVVKGYVATSDAGIVKSTIEYNGEIEGHATIAKVYIQGSFEQLVAKLNVSSLTQIELDADIKRVDEQLSFKVVGNHAELLLPSEESEWLLAAGKFALNGNLDNVVVDYKSALSSELTGVIDFSLTSDVTLPAKADSPILAKVDWQASFAELLPDLGITSLIGSSDIHYADKKLLLKHTTHSPYLTEATIQLGLESELPFIAGELAWKDIGPLLLAEKSLSSPEGKLEFKGQLPDIALSMRLQLDGEPWRSAIFSANANVNNTKAIIDDIKVETLDGEVLGDAELSWQPVLQSRFALTGHQLNLDVLGLDAKTSLAFVAKGEVKNDAKGLHCAINLTDLAGKWGEYLAEGKATMRIEPDLLTLSDAGFAVGPNTITADVELSDQLLGDFEFVLPDLRALDTRLAGDLSGSGTIAGLAQAPIIELAVNGHDIQFDSLSSQALTAQATLHLNNEKAASSIQLELSSPHYDDLDWQALTLSAQGVSAKHQFELRLEGEKNTLLARAKGVASENDWQGQINEFNVGNTQLGDWQLDQPMSLALSADKSISSSDSCFSQKLTKICFQADALKEKSGTANVSLSALPLVMLQPWLPEMVDGEGELSAQAQLSYSEEGVIAEGQFTVASGALTFREVIAEQDKTRRIAIEQFNGQFSLANESGKFLVNANLPGLATLKGQGELDLVTNGSLAIDVQARVEEIAVLKEFVPQIAGSEGSLIASAKISGTNEQPMINANASLEQGVLRIAEYGFELTELMLSAENSSDELIQINGLMANSEGQLTLDGEITVDAARHYPIQLKLLGDRFAVMRTPDMDIDISPDLVVSGDMGKTHIAGVVRVPTLRFEPIGDSVNKQSVSEDEVIVDELGQLLIESIENKEIAWLKGLSADVEVILGDQVSVAVVGVSSQLTGDIRVLRTLQENVVQEQAVQMKASQITAEGKINIVEGVFSAYGRKLDINKGVFLFAGPIDNPAIDLRATRQGIAITAGIEADGPARKPNIRLFSDPPLSDADTLSYILTGKPLSDASSADGQLVSQAALSFGLSQASVITNQVRDTFGLDEFGVDTGNNVASDASLVAGKRLSPKLSVRSQLNLFDQLWSFFLRYDLTDSWSIEAESGRRQGGDVVYSIEREKLF